MDLTVYNTLTGKNEAFVPREPGKVGMYACGVTVYDECHIGHAMQAILYDVIRNYLRYQNLEVLYVRNYTDVDDKIINKANELGISALEHSENMIQDTLNDLASLGVKPADIEPKFSDHIPEIIQLIEQLIEGNKAYAANGDVYFAVNSFPEYGKLSNRNPEELRSGARVEVNPNKKDPIDFALWKAAKEGEVSWESPWGHGRPGWHIECSALAMKYLGKDFDIHGGGKDLIFPHHENEIAQSMAACPCSFATYWIHNGLVTVEGRKMSKSLGNFITIKKAVADYFPETIRYTILCSHYSSNIDFSEKAFYDAYSRIMYFYNTLALVDEIIGRFPEYEEKHAPNVTLPDLETEFTKAMNDNFNTTAAIREIGAAFKFLNDFATAKKPKAKAKVYTLIQMRDQLKRVLNVLGFANAEPKEALAQIQTYLVKRKNIDTAKVDALIEERNQARANKDWARSDEIRDLLNEDGISVMDKADGTLWQVSP